VKTPDVLRSFTRAVLHAPNGAATVRERSTLDPALRYDDYRASISTCFYGVRDTLPP
jgi:hypothetical protein